MLGLKLLLRQLPQWYLRPIRVIYRFHSVEKHESGNSFFFGGGGCQRKSKPWVKLHPL